MRILLKCPTRSRPQRIVSTLMTYLRLANRPDLLGVAVSCDVDDESMSKNLVQEELHRLLGQTAWHRLFYSPNRSKIEACNANMKEIDWDWQIVVLVSDDMIPQIRGWDDVIRSHMASRFPDTNGLLWFNDGQQGDKLNTLSIYGRAVYNELGYLYCPEYKSLFCDTELTDRCRTDLASRTHYSPYCIIRHEHPGNGYSQNMDGLYARNQQYWSQDMYTYIRRKAYPFDVSFLLPTIPGRESSLQALIASIHEKAARLAPGLRYEITVDFDNREASIGAKRDRLCQGAKGKYIAFIDDDDEITDAYIEDLRDTVRMNSPVMRLRGQIAQYTFTHSLANRIDGVMARDDVFLRPPNHLNPMYADVAKLIHFRDAHRAEDLEWTIRLARSNFLKDEFVSDPSRIHYIYKMGARTVSPDLIQLQRTKTYEEMLPLLWKPADGSAPEPSSSGKPTAMRLTARGFVSR